MAFETFFEQSRVHNVIVSSNLGLGSASRIDIGCITKDRHTLEASFDFRHQNKQVLDVS